MMNNEADGSFAHFFHFQYEDDLDVQALLKEIVDDR